jgi:hypothetical protein
VLECELYHHHHHHHHHHHRLYHHSQQILALEELGVRAVSSGWIAAKTSTHSVADSPVLPCCRILARRWLPGLKQLGAGGDNA